jgi:hypothetical protein
VIVMSDGTNYAAGAPAVFCSGTPAA